MDKEQLKTIENLPNRFSIFTQQNFAIYVLDDYAVHLMPEIRAALLKKGYILIIIGGGVTGDIQINDTHFHGTLKAKYRVKEMNFRVMIILMMIILILSLNLFFDS